MSLPLMVTVISSVDITFLYHRGHRDELESHQPHSYWLFCVLGGSILYQVLFKVFRKSLDRRLNRPSGCIAQRTKGFALNVVTEVEQQLSIFRPAAAFFDAFENLDQPVGAFAT